ncbi:MAG TPA: lamin tail domain-containing protein [Polyangiales bacterium]|nr:lamin tail domain-containing protein [Polyangiales bacterium]
MRWVGLIRLCAGLCGCVESPALERVGEAAADAASLWEGEAGAPRPAEAEPAADGGELPAPALRRLDASVVRGGTGGAGRSAVEDASAAGAEARGPDAGDTPGASASGLQPSAAEPAARPARPSALVITEIMIDPKARSDSEGEWFELWNPGAEALDVYGCALRDGAQQMHAFQQHVRVAPGAFVAIARGEQPGFTPDLVFSFSLKNDSDVLELICDGVSIDRVAYDRSQGFPIVAGSAMSLDHADASADGNDSPAAWCRATQPYAGADLGSPAQPNPPCAGSVEDAGLPE